MVAQSSSNTNFTATSTLNNLSFEDPTETNLVGYWKFDDLTGETARDSSGTGNNGTLTNGPTWLSTGATPIDFQNSGAIQFDSTDAYVSLGTTSVPNTNVSQTVAFWVNYPAVPNGSGQAETMFEVLNAGQGYRIGFGSTDQSIRYYKDASSGAAVLASVNVSNLTTYPLNTWRHVAYTWDGTTHRLYLNGTEVAMSTTAPVSVAASTVTVGASQDGGLDEFFSGKIDDLRIYSTPLTAPQIASLYAGGYASTGGTSTFTLGANTTVGGAFGLDSGALTTSSNSISVTGAAAVNAGTFTLGGVTATFTGGLSVNPRGTFTMNTTGATIAIGNTQTLLIDGTFNASTAGLTRTIRAVAPSTNSYSFTVGSSTSETPVLNINGLAVQDTNTSGMNITTANAATTFTSFKSIDFSGGTGTYALQFNLPSISQYFYDLSFTDVLKVKLNDTNNGSDSFVSIAGTCPTTAAACEAADEDGDNEATPNGISDAGGGGVIQWIYSGYTDLDGTLSGFPAVAFRWDDFTYYATYVAYNNTAGGDVLYKRDTNGAAVQTWSGGGGVDFVGPPRVVHAGGTQYYIYVLTSNGTVYKISDTGGALSTVGSGYRHSVMSMTTATATSPLAMDTTYLYWMGNSGGGANTPSIMWVSQATMTGGSAYGLPNPNPSTTTSYTGPSIGQAQSSSATNYIFFAAYDTTAAGGFLYKLPITPAAGSNGTQPTAATYGRTSLIHYNVALVDGNGRAFLVNPHTLGNRWLYAPSGSHGGQTCPHANCGARDFFYNWASERIYWGDYDGHLFAIANGAVVHANYPCCSRAEPTCSPPPPPSATGSSPSARRPASCTSSTSSRAAPRPRCCARTPWVLPASTPSPTTSRAANTWSAPRTASSTTSRPSGTTTSATRCPLSQADMLSRRSFVGGAGPWACDVTNENSR